MRSTTSTSPRSSPSRCAERLLDRTFLAVDFDGAFLDEVAALASRLRGDPRLSNARWAKTDTFHTTLRFFGDTSDAQTAALAKLVRELAAEVSASPLVVRAHAVHGFPEPSRAHVLVLDVEDTEPVSRLAALAARAEAVAVSLGFAREDRAYHAHLTLARMRKATDVSPFLGEAAALPTGVVTGITLYASRSGPSGAVYTPLARAALT